MDAATNKKNEAEIHLFNNKRLRIKGVMIIGFYLLFSYAFTVVFGGDIFANNSADNAYDFIVYIPWPIDL